MTFLLTRERRTTGQPANHRSPSPDRRARSLRVIGLIALAIVLLTPVFRWNAFGAASQAAFDGWQIDSQALVLAKIESTTPQARAEGRDSFGMLYAGPDQMAPNATFDDLAHGTVPTTQQYTPYLSQIGLPGYLFTGLYHIGFLSLSSLQMVASALTVAVLLLFAWMLSLITRRSFGAVFLVVALGSPWLALAARNLYWVPWTWFLPACAAIAFIRARGRGRLFAAAVLSAAFFVKWASGYEFLTSVTLLAMAMPVLTAVFRPAATRRWRPVAFDTLAVMVVALVTFLLSVAVLALLIGRGDIGSGMGTVLFDAGKRTYGGVAVDDPVLAASLTANPVDVVATYLFGWQTDVLALGRGLPFQVVLGSRTFWMLVIAATAVVVARAVRHDARWTRDLSITVVALAVPLSWFVTAKAHSYVHPFINFVLFYLISVGALIWVIGAAAGPIVRVAVDRGAAAVMTRAGVPREGHGR